MQTNLDTLIQENSSPSQYAHFLAEEYASNVSKEHKKTLGQFFTPTAIAQFMGSLASKPTNKTLRILDPGCGTGILACSLIEALCSFDIDAIELVVYEIDSGIIPYLEKVLENLQHWLTKQGIQLKLHIITEDFIVDTLEWVNFSARSKFDYIISNPPYFKLPKKDKRVSLLQKIVKGQPNIYSSFMSIAARLLNNRGEMIFITPRSFTSGQYFNSFRDDLFQQVHLNYIHLFKSRSKTFKRDKVLQETLITKAKKQREQDKLTISTSQGIHDIENSIITTYSTNELLDLSSKAKILYLPTNKREKEVIKLFKSWENHLTDFDIKISTGPVVSFRAKPFLFEEYQNSTIFLAPLYWLNNINKMVIHWPLSLKNKNQYIIINEESKKILIPNKNYVLLRRFSSKDDKSRLIAAPYFSSTTNKEFIGVENKLNYIYKSKGGFSEEEVIGIAALLNSLVFDTFFRTFNGNVNVSATEIRLMPFPSINLIRKVGKQVIAQKDYSQEAINQIVDECLKISFMINE